MSTEKRLVLVVNTGEQDLKRWLDVPPGKGARKPHDRLKGRPLQKWLMDGQVQGTIPGYRILLPEEAAELWRNGLFRPVRNDKAVDGLGLSPGAARDRLRGFLRALDARDSCVVDEDLNVLLRPAKIEGLMPDLERCIKDECLAVGRVLVFATRRIGPEEYERRLQRSGIAGDDLKDRVRGYREGFYGTEPFATGAVIARWLAERLDLTYLGEASSFDGTCGVRWVNIMDGLSQFEGAPGTADHPLHRRLGRAIDGALSDAAAGFEDGFALICATGGSNDTKACILAAAELRFPGRAREYVETERGGAFKPKVFDVEPDFVIPTVSLEARAHCASLLLQGDPQGAWAAVSHLNGKKSETHWLTAVERLYGFFIGGIFANVLLHEPHPAFEQEGVPLLIKHAFQIEAALQGASGHRRISEALIGITAFAEHALYLMLCRAIPVCVKQIGAVRIADGAYLDDQGGLIGDDAQKRLPQELRGRHRDRLEVFGGLAKNARKWLEKQTRDGEEQDWPSMAGAVERLECYLHTPEAPERASGPEARHLHNYRNRLSHVALTSEEDKAVLALAEESQTCVEGPAKGRTLGPLWNLSTEGGEAPGSCFLASVLVGDVLRHFDIEDPPGLYAEMLAVAGEALHAPLSTD